MKKLITFLLFAALFQETANAATYYVNIGLAAGTNDGSSWNNAFQTWSAFTAVGSPGVVTISRSGAPFVTSAGASWNTGSTTITLSVSNPLILVGDAISGTGLASNTTVTAISGTTLTLSLVTTATVTAGFLADAVVDNIYIKGNIPSQSSLWVVGYLDNFYGSCYGTESSPSQRPMYDNDGNGIVESWEFQYPTTFTSTRGGTAINGSSAIFDGFTITHTGAVNGGTSMTTYISPIGQTVQNCVFTGSSLSYGATTAYTNGNGGCLLKVLGTFKNNLIEKNNVSLTYVTTSTSSTDIKVVPYLEVNFPATNNIVVSVSGCIFRNNVATISNSGTAGTTDNLRGMVLTTNHPNTAGLTGTSATFSDCIIHNNEITYSGTIMPGKASIASSLVLSSSSSYDNFINCTFANNKMTNMATCFYATSTGNVVHKVYNNALWNNKNTVSSTTSTVSMNSQSSQNANSVFDNNYVDIANSGNWGSSWGAGNKTNLSASNTGSNGPYFKKTPMNGANNIIGAFQSAGTELTAINQSDWRLNPGTYLNGKGITTTILKDKAGIDFSSTPSVGAYEYVKVTPTVTINVSSYIYNGSNQGPNSSTIGGTIGGVNSTGILSYIYSESGNSTLPINAGNFTVTATLAADTYYNSVSSSATSFSLSKKPLTIGAPSIASKTYDGSATSGTVIPGSLSGFVDPETVSVSSAIGTYPDANVGTGKSATIAYTLANGTNGGLAANYSLTNGSASGNITAASGSPTGDNLNNSGLTDNQLANTNLTISSGEFIINDTKTVRSLTIAPGVKLTHSSGTLTATNGITLESDATGTATLMDSYTEPTITATVKQYVTAGRNWYMSAPLNNTADYSALDKGASVAEYNEVTGLWPVVSSGTLTRGKGYVQVASASQGTTGTVSFSGTTNSGNVPVTLTYTSGKGNGYNLVGNPYPSYLSWSAVAADNTAANMPTGTMWYRTISYNGKNAWTPNTVYSLNDIVYNGTRFYKATSVTGTSDASGGPTGGLTGITDGSVVWNYEGSIYLFATISASGVASPATVSNLVPPMQAFWVKSSGGTLTFKNAMRAHNTGGTNALKAPKSSSTDIKLLRLNVSNGASADETVIYASTDASNAFDTYDAPKYFNTVGSNQPEIYTQVGNEKLVINAMNEIANGIEIPLGFATEKGNNFTISATELRNFGSDIKVMLKDKQTTTEFDLTAGQLYAFSSAVVNNTDRFSLIFRASGNTTAIDNAEKGNTQVFVNQANNITIIAPEKSNYVIYNAMGQIIEKGIATSNYQITNLKLSQGVYVVKVGNYNSTRVIIK